MPPIWFFIDFESFAILFFMNTSFISHFLHIVHTLRPAPSYGECIKTYDDNLPESTAMAEPVINIDSSDNKKATADAIFSGSQIPRYCL